MKMPIALSWSRLNTYMECPMKFKAQFIDKTYPDDSDNPHFARGSRIHKQLETYINNTISNSGAPAMSAEAMNAVPILNKVFQNYDVVTAERQIATNMDWKKCDWFDKPHIVKYRCIIDSLAIRDYEALSIDFKTGKVRPYDAEHGQLHLSSAMVMSIIPDIKEITNTYLFLDHKQTVSIKLKRSDIQKEIDHFDEMYEKVNADEDFAPTKHKYCGFCLIKNECPLWQK